MLVGVTVANDGSCGSTFNRVWEPATFNVVVTAVASTLALASTRLSAGSVYFDSVTVTAVPEIGTWALMSTVGSLAKGRSTIGPTRPAS